MGFEEAKQVSEGVASMGWGLFAAGIVIVFLFWRVASSHKIKTGLPKKQRNLIDSISSILDEFLIGQELLISNRGKIYFHDDSEKDRYFYFLIGAIDRLSRAITDSEISSLWWHTTALARASVLYGVDEGKRRLEDVDSRGGEFEEAGYKAMDRFLMTIAGNDKTYGGFELAIVVRDPERYRELRQRG